VRSTTHRRGSTLKVCRSSGRLTISSVSLGLSLPLGPGDELSGVAVVGPGQLDRRERLAQVPQQRPGRVAVVHGGGGDQHRKEQPESVDGQVPLGPVILSPQVSVRP
jgi:hypothetical protein